MPITSTVIDYLGRSMELFVLNGNIYTQSGLELFRISIRPGICIKFHCLPTHRHRWDWDLRGIIEGIRHSSKRSVCLSEGLVTGKRGRRFYTKSGGRLHFSKFKAGMQCMKFAEKILVAQTVAPGAMRHLIPH